MLASIIITIFEIHHRSTVFENHKKVSFNIASQASYIYILRGQKFMKRAQNGQLWRVFENLKFAVIQCYWTGQFQLDKNWWKMPKLTGNGIFAYCACAFVSFLSHVCHLKENEINLKAFVRTLCTTTTRKVHGRRTGVDTVRNHKRFPSPSPSLLF